MLPPDLITPKQAARLIGRHVSLIYRTIFDGRLRAWKVAGSRYQVRREDVLALVVEVRGARRR